MARQIMRSSFSLMLRALPIRWCKALHDTRGIPMEPALLAHTVTAHQKYIMVCTPDHEELCIYSNIVLVPERVIARRTLPQSQPLPKLHQPRDHGVR